MSQIQLYMFEPESVPKYASREPLVQSQQPGRQNRRHIMHMPDTWKSACLQGRKKLHRQSIGHVGALAFDLQGAFLQMLTPGFWNFNQV